MAERSLDIDRVVREVLAELGLAPAPGAAGSLSASVFPPGSAPTRADKSPVAPHLGDETAAPAPPASPGGELVVSSRVVTLSEVDGRLDAVRRLVVPPRAVVTPAVRDELRRRDVTLAYASPSVVQAARPVRLVLVTVGAQPDWAPLVGALRGEGIAVDQHRFDCLIAATDRLAGEIVKPDALGLLLTRHTAAGLCLANRLRGVRAVSGTDAGTVAAAAAAVGANLLVVDPAAVGPFQWRQIVTEFCRAGTRPCPEVFQQRLA